MVGVDCAVEVDCVVEVDGVEDVMVEEVMLGVGEVWCRLVVLGIRLVD